MGHFVTKPRTVYWIREDINSRNMLRLVNTLSAMLEKKNVQIILINLSAQQAHRRVLKLSPSCLSIVIVSSKESQVMANKVYFEGKSQARLSTYLIVQCEKSEQKFKKVNSSNIYYTFSEKEMFEAIQKLLEEDTTRDKIYMDRFIENRIKRHVKARDQYWVDNIEEQLEAQEMDETKYWEQVGMLPLSQGGKYIGIQLEDRLYAVEDENKVRMFLVYSQNKSKEISDYQKVQSCYLPIVKAWKSTLHFGNPAEFSIIGNLMADNLNKIVNDEKTPLSKLFKPLQDSIIANLQYCANSIRFIQSILEVANSSTYYIDESLSHVYRRIFNPDKRKEVELLIHLCQGLYYCFFIKFVKTNFNSNVPKYSYCVFDCFSDTKISISSTQVLLCPHTIRSHKDCRDPPNKGLRLKIQMKFRKEPIVQLAYIQLSNVGQYLWAPYTKFLIKQVKSVGNFTELVLQYQEDSVLALMMEQIVFKNLVEKAEAKDVKMQRYFKYFLSEESGGSVLKRQRAQMCILSASFDVQKNCYNQALQKLQAYKSLMQQLNSTLTTIFSKKYFRIGAKALFMLKRSAQLQKLCGTYFHALVQHQEDDIKVRIRHVYIILEVLRQLGQQEIRAKIINSNLQQLKESEEAHTNFGEENIILLMLELMDIQLKKNSGNSELILKDVEEILLTKFAHFSARRLRIYNIIGSTFLNSKKYELAEKYLMRSKAIAERTHGLGSPEIKEVYTKLSQLYTSTGNMQLKYMYLKLKNR